MTSARWASAITLVVVWVGLAARLAVPIPGTPVPVTLQDLAVLLAGVALGPTRAAAGMVSYLLVGALGAPVFSNGHAGLAWLMGPTGGYLLSYPAAAWLVGKASARGTRWPTRLAGALGAQAVIFTFGALQISLVAGGEGASVLAMAVLPFVVGILVKTTLVVMAGSARVRLPAGGHSGLGRD